MKVVYSWLKDFVDVTAPPQELASRLVLSGTNIAGVETGPQGVVIDAEVSSNRPDCLGHYGIAREVGAIYKLPLKHISPKPAESAAKASDAVVAEAIGAVGTDFGVDHRAMRTVFDAGDICAGECEARGEILRRGGQVDEVFQPVVNNLHAAVPVRSCPK